MNLFSRERSMMGRDSPEALGMLKRFAEKQGCRGSL